MTLYIVGITTKLVLVQQDFPKRLMNRSNIQIEKNPLPTTENKFLDVRIFS